ncbi:MAG: Rpn family recombination-promoting nuclease/putative transposase [Burkholderiales bacterium]
MKLTIKHDEFVKKCLTDIGVAKEFLEQYLDPKIKNKCDFSKLSIAAGSYIEDDLKVHASDIVYSNSLPIFN